MIEALQPQLLRPSSLTPTSTTDGHRIGSGEVQKLAFTKYTPYQGRDLRKAQQGSLVTFKARAGNKVDSLVGSAGLASQVLNPMNARALT